MAGARTSPSPSPTPAEVSQYTVNPTTGALSPKTPATVPTDEPEGIAVSGNSAYVTNIGMDTVSQYTIDPTTGALHPKVPATVPTFALLEPVGIAVSPNGKSAYVVNYPTGKVSQYTINPTTGSAQPQDPGHDHD